MKTIKRVILNEATELTNDERKMVFGGSATNANYTSSCSVTCKDDDYLDRVEITDCMGRCTASGDTVTCIGETLYLRKKCNGHESSGPISEL